MVLGPYVDQLREMLPNFSESISKYVTSSLIHKIVSIAKTIPLLIVNDRDPDNPTIDINETHLIRKIASISPIIIMNRRGQLDVNVDHFRFLKRDHTGEISYSILNLPWGEKKYKKKSKKSKKTINKNKKPKTFKI
jgi:hypothetical protein